MSTHYFNAYDLLNIDPKASNPEIKTAYRKKALEFHPDKHQNSGPANAMFKLITQAKDMLLDPQRRLEHDYAIGLKTKPEHSKDPEVVFVDRPYKETDWKTLIGVGLVGLAIGASIKKRKNKSKKR